MAELKPYNPTMRDRLARALLGDARPGSARANIVEGITGSRGIGPIGMGLIDFTPVGAVAGAQEAAQQGDYRGAAMNAMFLGPMARTANKTALTQAEKMAAGGANRDEIWNKTGWFQGPDSKWRFEISDANSKFNESAATAAMPSRIKLAESYFEQQGVSPIKFMTGQYKDLDNAALSYADARLAELRSQAATQPLSQVLSHDSLYAAYPHLKEIPVAKENLGGIGGSYNQGRITYGNAPLGSQFDNRSVLSHELQHAVQDAEGFARGGAPGMVDYRRLAGEVEARNVQNRLNMTPEQRRAAPPWVTQDVPFSEQILRAFGGK